MNKKRPLTERKLQCYSRVDITLLFKGSEEYPLARTASPFVGNQNLEMRARPPSVPSVLRSGNTQ